MSFISNKLIHWVGSGKSPEEQYSLLTQEIVRKKRLKFNECAWTFRTKYGGVERDKQKYSMICFTDIPLSEAPRSICERYSSFGIAFEKAYLSKCTVSPVGYVLDPRVYIYFSHIFHTLSGIRPLVANKTIPEGARKGELIDIDVLLAKFMHIMAYESDYSRTEFDYDNWQDGYFERDDALYFEREWRMVITLRPIDESYPWLRLEDNNTKLYFQFDERYVPYVIMPRQYRSRLIAEHKEVFESYNVNHIPAVITFEDLRYM